MTPPEEGAESCCSLLELGLSILYDLWSRKETGNTHRCRESIIIIKVSKIIMLNDIVANTYDDMSEDMGSFSGEVETLIIVRNKRGTLD